VTVPGGSHEQEHRALQLLERLPALIEAVGRGLHVYLHVDGTHRQISAAVDGAAYLIIQDVLGRVIRHGPGASATVTVHFHAHELYLSVVDHGWQQTNDLRSDEDRVMTVLRERAASVGGTLDVSRSIGGGCSLIAHLPQVHDRPPAAHPLDSVALR
jgi:signal transduction histidine kinase